MVEWCLEKTWIHSSQGNRLKELQVNDACYYEVNSLFHRDEENDDWVDEEEDWEDDEWEDDDDW